MTSTTPHAGGEPIIVTMSLDGPIALALDQARAEMMSSRAGMVRRFVADALRTSGHLPPVPTGPRPLARTRPGAR